MKTIEKVKMYENIQKHGENLNAIFNTRIEPVKLCKLLLKKNHNLHFVIIGDGDNRQKLTQYALDLQISENVTFTGFIENAKKIIPEIDILLFTSTEEGLGSTILDF